MPATNKSPRAAEGQDTDLVFRRLEGTSHINQGKREHRISTWESLGDSDPPGCLVGGQLVEKVAHLGEDQQKSEEEAMCKERPWRLRGG